MKILDSKEVKPEKPSAKLERLIEDAGESLTEVKGLLSTDLKIDHKEFVEKLSELFDSSLKRLEAKSDNQDWQELVKPVANEIASLKADLKTYNQKLDKDPKVNVRVDPPDMRKINELVEAIPKSINALIENADIMERKELEKYLKEIVKYLKEISASKWVSQGTTIVSGSSESEAVSAYSDSSGTDKKGLVDADRHVQVDVLSAPTTAVTGPLTDAQLRDTPVPVSGTVTANPTTPTALAAFITTVTTAGTRVQLASNSVTGVILQAPSTNTGNVFIGGSTVSSTSYGAELQPGQSTSVAIDNTNKIYIDAATNGDKLAALGS